MDHVLEAQDVAAEETTLMEHGGCPFYKRCPKRWEKCLKAVPALYEEATWARGRVLFISKGGTQ